MFTDNVAVDDKTFAVHDNTRIIIGLLVKKQKTKTTISDLAK